MTSYTFGVVTDWYPTVDFYVEGGSAPGTKPGPPGFLQVSRYTRLLLDLMLRATLWSLRKHKQWICLVVYLNCGLGPTCILPVYPIFMLCQKEKTSPNIAGLVNFNCILYFRWNNLPSEFGTTPVVYQREGCPDFYTEMDRQ